MKQKLWSTTMMYTNVLNCSNRRLTALQIGFERPSVIPIHCGLISSYTAGLAAFGNSIYSLDKFNVHSRYCIQFCFFDLGEFTLIHCRNLSSRLYISTNTNQQKRSTVHESAWERSSATLWN